MRRLSSVILLISCDWLFLLLLTDNGSGRLLCRLGFSFALLGPALSDVQVLRLRLTPESTTLVGSSISPSSLPVAHRRNSTFPQEIQNCWLSDFRNFFTQLKFVLIRNFIYQWILAQMGYRSNIFQENYCGTSAKINNAVTGDPPGLRRAIFFGKK